MTTSSWVIIAWAIILIVISDITAAVLGYRQGKADVHARGSWRERNKELEAENKRLEQVISERDEARTQRDKLNRENADLHEKLRTQENFYKLYVTENEELTIQVKSLNAENEVLQKAQDARTIPARPVIRKAARKGGMSNEAPQ